jgi:transketolase
VRSAFVHTLIELAEQDDRIVLLTGDLGWSVLEPFAERFPERFYNAGVAEQNMVGVATGLAESGFIPFVYSIVTFATLRGFEFIRNGPVLHGLPVRIVGIGGGFEYGHAGPTHHGLEDVAVMRALRGMTIVAPADPAQATEAIRATWDLPGPIYYRLGKDDRRVVPALGGSFTLGRAQVVRNGRDTILFALGSVTAEVTAAADLLAADGIDAGVVVVASLAPPPVEDLDRLLRTVPLALSVEAHSINGGLGSLVCEVVAERHIGCRVVRCGVRDVYGVSGSERYLWGVHGLTADGVAAVVRRSLRFARAQ